MITKLMVFITAFVCFLIVPGLGAFIVRRRWRRLRASLLRSACTPKLQYHDQKTDSSRDFHVGERHMIAKIDAVEDKNVLLISNSDLSAAVEMEGQQVIMVSGARTDLLDDLSQTGDPPVVLPWDRMITLRQGMQVYVAGPVRMRDGRLAFSSTSAQPLSVVLFEGEPDQLLYRCLWDARQRNEYMNQLTPGSLILGSAILLMLSFFMLGSSIGRLWAVSALSLSFLPLVPMMPPGVIGYYIFRRLWRHGRLLRSQRDILHIPEHICSSLPDSVSGVQCYSYTDSAHFSQGKNFPVLHTNEIGAVQDWMVLENQSDDSLYTSVVFPRDSRRIRSRLNRKAYVCEAGAVALFLVSVTGNLYLLFVLLSYLV